MSLTLALVLVGLVTLAFGMTLTGIAKREAPTPLPEHEKEHGLMSCGDLVGETDEVCLPIGERA